jgi:UPF0755 protein
MAKPPEFFWSDILKGRKFAAGCLVVVVLGLSVIGFGYFWLEKQTQPVPKGELKYVRLKQPVGLEGLANRLKLEGVIRDEMAFYWQARLRNKPRYYRAGLFQVAPGMTVDELVREMQSPIRLMFRFPETNWARRSANLLEKQNICKAEDYMAVASQPDRFRDDFDIPLPREGLMEGFLFPDTYEVFPQMEPEEVVERQLQAFEDKAMPLLKGAKDPYRILIIASMVELEVALDKERSMVAGVIQNRMRIGMPLQIDATINYGIQKWRPLTYADLRKDTPYNTYTRKGLPPTPICSPSLASIRAALNPAKHDYLYYVAMPEKYHLFSSSYSQHLKNIAKRKAALAKQTQ